MAEYVTKEQVIDWYRPYGQTDEPIPFETLVSDLRDMKAADVATVRHGRWIDKGEYAVCTECGGRSGIQHDGVEPIPLMTQFCPNCGCYMDGGDDE